MQPFNFGTDSPLLFPPTTNLVIQRIRLGFNWNVVLHWCPNNIIFKRTLVQGYVLTMDRKILFQKLQFLKIRNFFLATSCEYIVFAENMTCFWLIFSLNASDEKVPLPLGLFKWLARWRKVTPLGEIFKVSFVLSIRSWVRLQLSPKSHNCATVNIPFRHRTLGMANLTGCTVHWCIVNINR